MSSGATYSDAGAQQGKHSPRQQQHTPPDSPSRKKIHTSYDKDGNKIERWDEDEAPGIRTHDNADEDVINAKLFGPGAVKKAPTYRELAQANIATSYDADGNKVQMWDKDDAPKLRTHDQSDQDAINETLFGKNAPKPPSYRDLARTNTSTSIDADGNKVEQWKGEEAPRVRTHDHSDQDAINEKLFGKGARQSPSRSHTEEYTNADGDREQVLRDGANVGIRTHDYSNQDEVNERLFGKGARND